MRQVLLSRGGERGEEKSGCVRGSEEEEGGGGEGGDVAQLGKRE